MGREAAFSLMPVWAVQRAMLFHSILKALKLRQAILDVKPRRLGTHEYVVLVLGIHSRFQCSQSQPLYIRLIIARTVNGTSAFPAKRSDLVWTGAILFQVSTPFQNRKRRWTEWAKPPQMRFPAPSCTARSGRWKFHPAYRRIDTEYSRIDSYPSARLSPSSVITDALASGLIDRSGMRICLAAQSPPPPSPLLSPLSPSLEA